MIRGKRTKKDPSLEAYLVDDMGINDSFQCEEEKYSRLKKAAFAGVCKNHASQGMPISSVGLAV
jgi:hypothetical protein